MLVHVKVGGPFEPFVQHLHVPHPRKREDAHVVFQVAAPDDVPVSALADHVVRVERALHERGLLERLVFEAQDAPRLESVHYRVEGARVDLRERVRNERYVVRKEARVHRDAVGKRAHDFSEHGAELPFDRRVAVLHEQLVEQREREEFPFFQRDVLYEEVLLRVMPATVFRVVFERGSVLVAQEVQVAIYRAERDFQRVRHLLRGRESPRADHVVDLVQAKELRLGLAREIPRALPAFPILSQSVFHDTSNLKSQTKE